MNTNTDRLTQHPCECTDPDCKAHRGSECAVIADCQTLYRVDMEDETGTAMCDDCADDAFASGLFTTRDEDEERGCDECLTYPCSCDVAEELQ